MALPPLRHPAWPMVAVIACAGAALTGWMGGSRMLSLVFLALAAVFALVVAARLKRQPGSEPAMKSRAAAFLPLLLLSACASHPPESSLVDLHMRARGGSTAVHEIQAIELKLDLVEPSFALQADYVANRSRCMRIDISSAGQYLQSEGVSRDGGWAVSAGDKKFSPQAEGGTATLLHGIDNPVRLIGLDEFPSRGHVLEVAGRRSIDGNAFDRIDVTYADGYTAELYLDPATHLVASMREHKPMHLANDPTKQAIETQFSDYRAVDGVQFPFYSREVNWETGKELGHTTVESIELDSANAIAACTPPVLPRVP